MLELLARCRIYGKHNRIFYSWKKNTRRGVLRVLSEISQFSSVKLREEWIFAKNCLTKNDKYAMLLEMVQLCFYFLRTYMIILLDIYIVYKIVIVVIIIIVGCILLLTVLTIHTNNSGR